jgi:hypothetical protein
MRNTLRSALTAGAFALCAVAGPILLSGGPAYAVCNPGTPHCIGVAPGSRLAQLKAKLNNPGTLGSGDIYCKNSSLCGIDTGDGTSPGVLMVRPR